MKKSLNPYKKLWNATTISRLPTVKKLLLMAVGLKSNEIFKSYRKLFSEMFLEANMQFISCRFFLQTLPRNNKNIIL